VLSPPIEPMLAKRVRTTTMRLQQQQLLLRAKLDRPYDDRLSGRISDELDHAVPPQDAVHRGGGDHKLMESVQVRCDPGRPEVIMLAQIEDFTDHLARGGSRRSMRRPRPIAQPGVTVIGVSLLPLVERFPGKAEPSADAGDVSLVARVPQHLQPPRRQTGLATFRHRLSAKADKPKEES